MADTPPHKHDLDGVIARGAVINALGTIGKLLFPVYIILITRSFGPATMGVFLLCYTILEVVGYLSVGGLSDGVVMFGSRYADDEEHEDELYRILANGVALTLGLAALIVVGGELVGPWLLRDRYEQYDLVPAFRVMLLALPFTVFATVVVAATRALLLMQWEALITNFIRPVALVVLTVIARYGLGEKTVPALAWCYLLASVVTAVVALVVFGRYFSYAKLARHLVKLRVSAPLIRFAIPQNLNMTFNHFITNVDVVMLGYFKVEPALIGFYGVGAQIVGNIKQIQLAFSGVFAPVVPRLHVRNDIDGISQRLATVSRWAVSLAIPTGLVLMFFRQELLQIFEPSFSGDTTFMVLLGIRPIFNCAVGMSGNVIVMTGHSIWNLINSTTVAAMNIVLNYLLIPHYGLTGAAVATMIASLTVTFAQVVEMRVLIGAKVLVGKLYKPFVAALPGVIAVIYLSSPSRAVLERTGWCAAALAIYAVLLLALRLETTDREMLARLFRR